MFQVLASWVLKTVCHFIYCCWRLPRRIYLPIFHCWGCFWTSTLLSISKSISSLIYSMFCCWCKYHIMLFFSLYYMHYWLNNTAFFFEFRSTWPLQGLLWQRRWSCHSFRANSWQNQLFWEPPSQAFLPRAICHSSRVRLQDQTLIIASILIRREKWVCVLYKSYV